MYAMKISRAKGNVLLGVRHYEHFENAVADLQNICEFDCIPDDLIVVGCPHIYAHSTGANGIADDFEFRYSLVTVYIGRVVPQDFKAKGEYYAELLQN